MKVAIVYDRVNKWGGAERVLLALHDIFPEAPLYTAVYDPKKAPWANVFPKVIPSFLQKIPFAKSNHELLGFLTPTAFETFNFEEYDLVISVSSEASKGIITKPETVHICYCLTPTRYLWSHYETYFKGVIFRLVTRPLVNYLKDWDKIAAQRPDVMIAISTAVQARIKKYYKRGSEVIYPPVDSEKFKNNPKTASGDYYLVVSRLVPYKNIELAVRAFNELRLPLVVVGKGSEENKLKKIAKRNISFKGFIPDHDLPRFYGNARALVFPGEEDFGIVMVEALASGIPVIAYEKGGALDIVKENKNGVFFGQQNPDSLAGAVRKFENLKFDKKLLFNSAEKFSEERFKREFLDFVKKSV